MNQLKQLWNNLHSSLWFLPSLIVAGSIVLAAAGTEIACQVLPSADLHAPGAA